MKNWSKFCMRTGYDCIIHVGIKTSRGETCTAYFRFADLKLQTTFSNAVQFGVKINACTYRNTIVQVLYVLIGEAGTSV